MNTIKAFGKFLDQPVLVKNFSKTLTPVIGVAAAGVVAKNAYHTPKKDRKDKFVQNGLTMFGAVASSLMAPSIISKIFRTAPKSVSMRELKKANVKLIEDFVSKHEVKEEVKNTLSKMKTGIIHVKEIKKLANEIDTKEGRELINKLIPEPENITSKEIFSEIGRLSVFGLIPVIGGIAGGILGDKLTDNNYKEKIPNKVKEGAYQYLANIFLCNIGAGTALAILEKFNVRSKSARALGMVTGITLTGIVGGSAIANFIGHNIIDKCFKNANSDEVKRRPEPLDICLHSDDIATVAVMSGLKWIEPVLPALYSISGYRAGIGYRGHGCKESRKEHLELTA